MITLPDGAMWPIAERLRFLGMITYAILSPNRSGGFATREMSAQIISMGLSIRGVTTTMAMLPAFIVRPIGASPHSRRKGQIR